MDTNLTKSLTDLIDETLQELEELRKSRFAAAEIKIEGPGDGIDGKPSNGDLHAKAEDKKDDDKEEDDKEDEAKKGENEEAAKGENEEAAKGENEEAAKAESKKDDDKKDDKEPHKDDPEHEEKEKKMAQKLLDMHKGEMKKSFDDSESLMKTYVEDRVKPLEAKLETILNLVNKIADQPVAPKGVTSATPLFKSDAEVQPLSKSEVAGKLFELKKSGTRVDSLDITKAEMGQDLASIMKKYEIS